MTLTRQERRALTGIEERLAFDDPELDALLSGGGEAGHDADEPVTLVYPAGPWSVVHITRRGPGWWPVIAAGLLLVLLLLATGSN